MELAGIALTAGIIAAAIVLAWRPLASRESVSPEPGLDPRPDRIDALVDRLGALELRLERLERREGAEGDVVARTPVHPRDAAPFELGPDEFVARHGAQVLALIDESRMEQDWRERARELPGVTWGFETEFGLPPRSLATFLVQEFRPLFEVEQRWRDDPKRDPSIDPPELTEARLQFLEALDGRYPRHLADRIFCVFGWGNASALSAREFSDEMVRRSVQGMR